MTDRELLERAAKSAGLILNTWPGEDFLRADHSGLGQHWNPRWNPLTDDGDAFRLAVALKMDVLRADDCIEVQCGDLIERDGEELYAFGIEPLGDDPAAATRRAIVRAAAAMSGGEG